MRMRMRIKMYFYRCFVVRAHVDLMTLFCHACDSQPFLTIYLGEQLPPPQGNNPPPPVKPFLPPKCEAELPMIAVRIAVDLLDNEIMPFHSLLHSHLVCNSYCSSPSIS